MMLIIERFLKITNAHGNCNDTFLPSFGSGSNNNETIITFLFLYHSPHRRLQKLLPRDKKDMERAEGRLLKLVPSGKVTTLAAY